MKRPASTVVSDTGEEAAVFGYGCDLRGLLLLIYRFWYLDMLMGHATCPIPSQYSSQYIFLCNFIFHVLSHHVSQIKPFLNHVPFRLSEKISIFMHVWIVACVIIVPLRR